MLKELIAVFRP